MYGFFWWDFFKKELDKGYLILLLTLLGSSSVNMFYLRIKSISSENLLMILKHFERLVPPLKMKKSL